LTDFLKVQNLTKTLPSGAELFHERRKDERTDGQRGMQA